MKTLWLPLIAAGGAERVTPEESLTAIASALRDVGMAVTVKIVISQDKILDRRAASEILSETLGLEITEAVHGHVKLLAGGQEKSSRWIGR